MSGHIGRRRGRRLAGLLALASTIGAVAVAFPSAAGAADYCVAPNSGCANDVGTLQQALSTAASTAEPDRVILGADTYTAPNGSGFDYLSNSPVEIIGKGTGATTLTSPAGSAFWVLRLSAGGGSSIQDLTIRLPQNVANNFSGLHTNSAARRIEVIEASPQLNSRYGVDLVAGGTLEDSSVTLNGLNGDTTGVWLVTPDTGVRRSAMTAQVGVASWGGTIEHSRMTATRAGVRAERAATTLRSSLIRATGNLNSYGIDVSPKPGSDASLRADGVTIVGPGTGIKYSYGASASTESAPDGSAELSITNAVIRDVARPLFALTAGAGHATLAATYSDYDPSGNAAWGAHASVSEANVSNVGEAHFADTAGGDFRLLPGSPLIDAGDPATPQGTDLDGNPLLADGNLDGMARRDLGAFEHQPPAGVPQGTGAPGDTGVPGGTPQGRDTVAPLVGRLRATPSMFAVARARTPLAAGLARGTRFRYALSEPARITLTIQRARSRHRYRTVGRLARSGRRGTNSVRFSGRLGRRALRPGRYRARLTAVDAAGNRSVPRSARFRIARG